MEKYKLERKVPFADLRITDDKERKELLEAIDTVFKHGRIVLGPEVGKFESKIADFCGRKTENRNKIRVIDGPGEKPEYRSKCLESPDSFQKHVPRHFTKTLPVGPS